MSSRGRGLEQQGMWEGTAGNGVGGNVSRKANYVSRKCNDLSLIIPFYVREGGELGARRGPSAFKNMLFLTQDGRLLRARRACSQTLFVTF